MNKKYWHTKRGFINPDGRHTLRGFRFTTLRWLWSRIFVKPYKLGVDLPLDHALSSQEAKSLFDKHSPISSITWLGHVCFLFRINGVTIITDPLLFGNPGPSFIKGLKRIESPLLAKDLNIDVLLLSHEHADHIHHPTLKIISNKLNIQVVTPVGISKKIQRHGFRQATELDWFESMNIGNKIKITAVPAVHYSNFSNTTLWAGYIISYLDNSGIEKKIYFAGDTDYGSFIQKDIAPLGPFDVACVGVGGFYLSFPTNAEIVHTNPEEAIDVAKEIKAKRIIGMHWGTMRMGDEDPNELLPRMKKQAEKNGYTGGVSMLRIGETVPI